MHIVVCVKQVPDTTEVRIDPETNTLVRSGVASVLNPFDSYALEEGVLIRERLGGEGHKVTAVSMGPPQAEAMLRDCIALGADDAVLLCDRAFAGGDTWATSLALSLAVKKLGADLVICGKQAIDGDTAQVGPGIACHLDWPQACYASKLAEVDDKRLVVECLLETGREVLEVSLPAVMTVVKDINLPRLPSLKGKMKAKKATITVWSAADVGADPKDVGLTGSPTAVNRTFSPPKRAGGEIVPGESPTELAKNLVYRLRTAQII